MPSTCVEVMLRIFGSSTQLHEYRLQAGRVTSSLLTSHKCQRTALRFDVSLLRSPDACPPEMHVSHTQARQAFGAAIMCSCGGNGCINDEWVQYCREGSGFESLATQLSTSKDNKAFVHLSLEILSQAVRDDGHCKAALADRQDILKSLAELLAYEQVRH